MVLATVPVSVPPDDIKYATAATPQPIANTRSAHGSIVGFAGPSAAMDLVCTARGARILASGASFSNTCSYVSGGGSTSGGSW